VSDDFPGPLHECDQDVERAAAERYRIVTLLEQPLGRKQTERLMEPAASAILTFSHRIQRAKASAIGHVRCAQLSRTFVIHGGDHRTSQRLAVADGTKTHAPVHIVRTHPAELT
jgi:hypothetical protein